MSRRKLLLAGAAVTLGLVAGLLAFLNAGWPEPISWEQVESIQQGMTEAEVAAVLGRLGFANRPPGVIALDAGPTRIPKRPHYTRHWISPDRSLAVVFDAEARTDIFSTDTWIVREGLITRAVGQLRRLLP